MKGNVIMNRFVESMEHNEALTLTENGAVALNTTGNYLIDLFGKIGAMRSREDSDIISSFSKAMAEDKLLATKMSFYARNIRGGLGERRVPKVIWKYMAIRYTDIMSKNMVFIPTFGRWDDIFVFFGTPLESQMVEFVGATLNQDIVNMISSKPVTLLAKWMPNEKSHNPQTRDYAKKFMQAFCMNKIGYHKTLSRIRKYLKIVEIDMSSKNWSNINYSSVPSEAMNNYRCAFRRNDFDRFNDYMGNVKEGVEKIHSGTLYPYDITEKYMRGYSFVDEVLEEQWKALPNYIDGNNNILIMADTSGSMYGRPIATSVGLAVYFAQRNHGVFHNKFMTFSDKPSFISLVGDTLYDQLKNAKNAHWDNSTNLHKALMKILDIAVKNNLEQEELPKSLIIISDMQIDAYELGFGDTLYDTVKSEFNRCGYDLPNIVFWNVASRSDIYHADSQVKGVQFVSGQSQSIIKYILNCADKTAYEIMEDTLSDSMYDCIQI